MGYAARFDLEGAHQVIERLAKKLEAGQIFEIAQMLALVGQSVPRQRKDALHVAADSQQRQEIRLRHRRHFDCQRHESTRPPEQLRRIIDDRRY